MWARIVQNIPGVDGQAICRAASSLPILLLEITDTESDYSVGPLFDYYYSVGGFAAFLCLTTTTL